MKTIHSALAASILLSLGSGCADESGADDAGDVPQVDIGLGHLAGYVLPHCTDPSGFCVTSIPVPTYLPPRGGFDADSRGLFYISYRPDFISRDVTYPDYYTALQVDWDGHIVNQSRSLPGRPAVKNPVIVGKYFVFGEGTRNAVMDVTGASNPFLTSAQPYSNFSDLFPNGGVILGDGRYFSTTDYGGGALGITGGTYAYPNECGPTDAYQCQRPATDHAPGATGYLTASSNSITRVRVPSLSAPSGVVTFGNCSTPASWTINPSAPLASAPDGEAGQMHAAFRLTSGTLVDCRSTGDFYNPTLRTVSLPATARDYEFDSTGGLWITMYDLAEVAYRSRTGAIQRVKIAGEPVYVKVMPDDSAVVLTTEGRFLRIRRA